MQRFEKLAYLFGCFHIRFIGIFRCPLLFLFFMAKYIRKRIELMKCFRRKETYEKGHMTNI